MGKERRQGSEAARRAVDHLLSAHPPKELEELQYAAVRQGRTVSDLLRTGALKEARAGREYEALNEARAKARDLVETLERLS